MFQILLLISLVKVLTATRLPFLCSTIYAGALLIFSIAFAAPAGTPLQKILIGATIAFCASSVYFWLLKQCEGRGLLWWVVMLVGFICVILV